MAGNIARHLTVHGQVQGVFFRAQTRQVAEQHGVTGWVANRADRTVEAWLEGPAGAVAAVERWVRDGGPPRAEVAGVDARDVAAAGHTGFEVRG